VKRWVLLVVLLLMLPALACSFSVDLDEEGAESTEPARVPTEPPSEEPASPLSPTPTLPVAVTVGVAADGGGDYPTLAAAVDAVAAGSTIVLGAGTYRLAEVLEINKSLRLEGAGMDQTFVVGEGGEYVVRFEGPWSFAVEDITFRYEGTSWGSVVVVDDGDLEFKRCRFSGGVWSEEERRGGSGLVLLGDTVGSIEGCRMEENQLHGIVIHDQGAPTIEGNICSKNGQSGIVYFDEASGLARQNECTGNGLHGIAVEGQATPTLEGNVCSENEQAGIVYSDDAGGLARQNECTGNGLHGIAVKGQATPTLEGNVCSENGEIGIRYAGDAGGLARQNECTGNGLDGISVIEQAQPTLEENVCRDNVQCGISYFHNGGGVARRNECSASKYGIFIDVEAHPELVDNYCHDNGQDVRDDRS
jgi:parallel beta-helix repeat protein